MQNKDQIDALLARYQEADAAAFDQFFKLTQDAVYNYFLSKFRRKEDADEGVQETYLRIHKYVMSYDTCRSGQAWMFSIARNVFIDIVKKRRYDLSIDEVEHLSVAGNAADSLHVLTMKRQLEKLLHPLTDEESTLLETRLMDGQSFDAMSESMKISAATLRQKYSRLIRRLKAVK